RTIEDAEFGLLLRDGLLRRQVHKVQAPELRHLVAISVGFREMISSIEEENRNIRNAPAQQVENDHILRLKAARYAGGPGIFGKRALDQGFRRGFRGFPRR